MHYSSTCKKEFTCRISLLNPLLNKQKWLAKLFFETVALDLGSDK